MSLLFNGSAALISIILFILLCVILQKNIVSEVQPVNNYDENNERIRESNNPYGDQSDKEMLHNNIMYVTDCPDYWTPYIGDDGEYTCVSENPVYNNKMKEILKEADNNDVKSVDIDRLEDLEGNGLTSQNINNIEQSSTFSQNDNLYIIPNSSRDLENWHQKCNWTQNTCLPWSGINSSHTFTTGSENHIPCDIPTKCLNHDLDVPVKPTPGIDTSKRPIYFYNYSLGNLGAVNTQYVPNLYNTNLLKDRVVDKQRKTGLLSNYYHIKDKLNESED